MYAVSSLQDLVKATGLKFLELDNGAVAVPFRPERAEQLVVQAKVLEGDLAYFAVPFPKVGWLSEQVALHNLLRLSYLADYVKTLALKDEELLLAAELPMDVLTPQVTEGVIRGLARLADVKKGDAAKWESLQTRIAEHTMGLAEHVSVDLGRASEEVTRQANSAGFPCQRLDEGGCLVELRLADVPIKLVFRPRKTAVSFIVFLGDTKPKGDKKKCMWRLLELNRMVNVAKVSLDKDGDVALLYELPVVTPDALQKVSEQMTRLLAGVLTAVLESGN